jgi:acetyl esterase
LPDVSKRNDPHASPLQTPLEQLKGLLPALIITDENDVLRRVKPARRTFWKPASA